MAAQKLTGLFQKKETIRVLRKWQPADARKQGKKHRGEEGDAVRLRGRPGGGVRSCAGRGRAFKGGTRRGLAGMAWCRGEQRTASEGTENRPRMCRRGAIRKALVKRIWR